MNVAQREQYWARERTACRLGLVRQNPNLSIEWGSGFHYGGGWIVTTGGVAGVNGVNIPNLWVCLNAPAPENPYQMWRTLRPRPRFGICLHVSEQAELQRVFGGTNVCDIVAFQLDPDELNNVSAGITGVPGALPFPIQLLPNTFDTFCIHGATGMLQLIGARYSAMPIQSQCGPVLYQASAAAGIGSSGAPVFNSAGQFVGVHCVNERGYGFIVSSVVVRYFMMRIIPISVDVQRWHELRNMLENPSLPHHIRTTTVQHCENIVRGIDRALTAMPWSMNLRC